LVAYARAGDGDMCEVDFFLGPNWLVTVRETNGHGETFPIAEVTRRYERIRSLDPGVGFLLYCLLDELVDGYFGEAERAEDALEVIEETLFDLGPPSDGSLQQELLDLRRSMITFRRRVVPLRDVVLSLLRREVPWVEEASIVYFEDVFDHLLRVLDQIDTQRELMGNVVDASLALTSNRMNEVMKKMTSWGAILIVATLIAGIYGMNFTDMPELHWRFGYYGALGLMLVTTSCLYFYFRRKKWL
jgi:magnesium transporter